MKHIFISVCSKIVEIVVIVRWIRTAVSFSAPSHSVTAHQEASVSSAVSYSSYCSTELSFLLGNDLRLLFSRLGSISSLFKTPRGEETSVCVAISREHIGVSAGLTVADKSCMINTHTRAERGAGSGSLLLGEQQTSGWALIINHQTRFYKAFSRKAWQHGEAFACSTWAQHYWIKLNKSIKSHSKNAHIFKSNSVDKYPHNFLLLNITLTAINRFLSN